MEAVRFSSHNVNDVKIYRVYQLLPRPPHLSSSVGAKMHQSAQKSHIKNSNTFRDYKPGPRSIWR